MKLKVITTVFSVLACRVVLASNEGLISCMDLESRQSQTGKLYEQGERLNVHQMSPRQIEQLRKALRLHFQKLDDERAGLVRNANLDELSELGEKPYAMKVIVQNRNVDVINFAAGDTPIEYWFLPNSRDLYPITIEDDEIHCSENP